MLINNIAKDKEHGAIERFASISQFIQTINDRPQNPAFESLNSSHTGSKKFTGTESYEDAEHLLNFGDPKTAKKIKPARGTGATEASTGVIEHTRVTKAPAGFRPIIPLALMNQPNNMLTITRNRNRGRIINLYYNFSAPYFVKAHELQKVGKNLLCAIAGVEATGIRVNLFVGSISVDIYTPEPHRYIGVFVNVKRSTDPANLFKLAYPVTHPSFFRRHMFKYRETTPAPVTYTAANNYLHTVSDAASNYIDLKKDEFILSFADIRHDTPKDILFRLIGKQS